MCWKIRRVLIYKNNEYTKTVKETKSIEISSEKFILVVLFKIFKVNVTKINIINKQNRIKITRGKKVRVPGFKKAIITLKKGQSIDLTTGI